MGGRALPDKQAAKHNPRAPPTIVETVLHVAGCGEFERARADD